MIQFKVRHGIFKCMRPQFLALRTAGTDVQQMARASGTPMFLYSNECYGLSDTALHASRSSVASATANATFGKQLDLVLCLMDGASGKLDPAFDAHTGPFKSWALTVWSEWFPTDVLQFAIDKAKLKLQSAKGSMWAVAAGPVTAFIATAKRITWTINSATTATDDLQRPWCFATDSPAAIADAVANSVRRWRPKRIFQIVHSA